MNSKALKKDNLPTDIKPEKQYDAKPIGFLVACFIFGSMLCFDLRYLSFGVFLISIAIFALVFLPSRVLIEFYKDYMIVYYKVNQEDCYLIYYDEVVSWTYIKGRMKDYIYFELEEGETVRVASFSRNRIGSYLENCLTNREKKVIN